jgi:hypothetical protein
MAERPGFRPRPSAPMVSPALNEGADGRREGIRRELWDRLTEGGRNTAPARSFVGNPENPDMMPVRMSPWQQGMVEGAGTEPPPEGMGGPGGRGAPGGEPSTEQMIEIVMGPAIVNADPAFLQAAKQVLDTLKREGWPLTRDTVTAILDEIQKGKSPARVAREFRLKHGR